MKTAQELREELRPFLTGKRNRCFSEVEATLLEIYNYLDQAPTPATPTSPPEFPSVHLTRAIELLKEVQDELGRLKTEKGLSSAARLATF